MKKYLLAGTSAFALALTAGAANAQSAPGKFDVKISGDSYFEAGLVSATKDYVNDTGAKNTAGDFINRFRLTVNPEAKADNGLTYGATVRIRANASCGLVDGDRAYIYTAGAFGTLQAGVVNGPSDATYVGHPQDWQMLGNYDQWKYYVQSATTSNANETSTGRNGSAAWAWGQFGSGSSGAAAAPASEGMQLLHSHDIDTKLVYYTPRFFGSTPTSGLQGAVSYAPHVGSLFDGGVSVNTGVSRSPFSGACVLDSSGNAATAGGCQQVSAFKDVYELTANYNETFGDWLVKGSVGYTGGKAEKYGTYSSGDTNNYNDLSSFQVGALVGYNPWNVQIGGGFVDAFKSGYRKANTVGGTDYTKDQYSWNVGGQYTWGPAVFGVKFLEQVDAGDLITTGSRTLDSVTAGGMYTVAPGLRTGLEYTYFSAKSDLSLDPYAGSTGGTKQTGSVVLVRGIVSF